MKNLKLSGGKDSQRGATRPNGSSFDLGSVEIDNSARIASMNSQITAAKRAAGGKYHASVVQFSSPRSAKQLGLA